MRREMPGCSQPMKMHESTRKARWVTVVCLTACLIAAASAERASGVIIAPDVFLEFDTELLSMTLTDGPFPMPFASDPQNTLTDADGGPASIDGFGFVNSLVTITLSSQRATDPGPESLGQAFAFRSGFFEGGAGLQTLQVSPSLPLIDPNEWHGQQFFVSTFFEVFFDVTIQDVDDRPGRDFVTGTAFIGLQDLGPGRLTTSYDAIFDMFAPNFGLIPPPEADPYFGHFGITVDLGIDINADGTNDTLTFALATHSVLDEGRTFLTLPDGTVIDAFDSAAFLEGALNPPFQIGGLDPDTGLPDPNLFGGPTTASSHLNNPVLSDVPDVPEPASMLVWSLLAALGITAGWRRRRKPGVA